VVSLFLASLTQRQFKHFSYFLQLTRVPNTTRDAILTCDQKLTQVSLINRTEPTTKTVEKRKTKM